VSLSSPSEFVSAYWPIENLRSQLPFLEFCSSSRHKNEKSFSLIPKVRRLRFRACVVSTRHSWFRPQCFSHSRRFLPSQILRAYFISQPRLGFPFQGVSLQLSQRYFSTSRSFMTFMKIRLPVPPVSWLLNLQAFLVPAKFPGPSKNYSKLQSVAICRGINPTNRSIPSYGFNSCRLFFVHRRNAFTPHPLMTLISNSSQWNCLLAYSDFSVPDHPVCPQTFIPFELPGLFLVQNRSPNLKTDPTLQTILKSHPKTFHFSVNLGGLIRFFLVNFLIKAFSFRSLIFLSLLFYRLAELRWFKNLTV
jgi:hypothetical protein